jgi:hypothetical protein
MVASKEPTPAAYLASLPPERRAVIGAVRDVILSRLPDGYVETMNWGMLSYEIPLHTHGDTYNRQPLSYVALAAQKHSYSVYLMNLHGAVLQEVQQGFAAAGKRLDMGKCCIRFKRLADLPLDVIGDAVAATPVAEMIRFYESAPRKKR